MCHVQVLHARYSCCVMDRLEALKIMGVAIVSLPLMLRDELRADSPLRQDFVPGVRTSIYFASLEAHAL